MSELHECTKAHECPECLAGKHGNCDRSAYCSVDDTIVYCDCECAVE